MSTIFRVFRVVIVAAVCATPLLAMESRQHYVVLERNRTPAYEVTRIHNDAADATTRTFLISDTKGPFVRIDVTSDYPNRKSVTSYTLMRGSKASGRVVLDLPYSSATREGRKAEATSGHLSEAVPVSVESSSGKSFQDVDGNWRKSDTANERRAQAKGALGGELVAALENIREIAGLPMFADLNASFVYVFDPGSLVHKSMKLMVAIQPKNCAFDAKFGVPCN